MQRETEIELIEQLLGLSAQKSTYLDEQIAHSPISRYSSAERFEREFSMIFRRKPIIAAHSSELEEANAFIARDFMGLPMLLARDADGNVNAFLNVCRHRGAKLERDAAGCKRVFTCPYHAWSWSNQGALRAVPQEAPGFPDLERTERGLRRLPVKELHGFIWIIANPDAAHMPDLEASFGALSDDFKWLDVENHRIGVVDTIEVKANWKVLVEGGLEAYHFRIAHKNTIGPHFPDNLTTYQSFSPHMRGVLPRNSLLDLHDVPKDKWHIRRDANLLYTLFPNTQMLVQQDHFMWFHLEPVAVDRTRFRMATMVPQDAPRTEEMEKHWQKNHAITVTALREDFDIGEEIQSGFASRGNPSHLFGLFEGALNLFNKTVEEAIAS